MKEWQTPFFGTTVPRNGFSQISKLGNLISVCFSCGVLHDPCFGSSRSHLVKTHIRLRKLRVGIGVKRSISSQASREKGVLLMITDARELGIWIGAWGWGQYSKAAGIGFRERA